MRVENWYIAVDWPRLQRLPKGTDLGKHFVAAIGDVEEFEDEDDAGGSERRCDDAGATGARTIDFGSALDDYFSSWHLLMEFSDWFRPVRRQLDPQLAAAFAELFTNVGLLFDDTFALAGLKQGVPFSDEWLVAAISPPTVEELCGRARSLDVRSLEQEFGRALSRHPCECLPDGAAIVRWVDALHHALSEVAGRGEGLVVGAA